MLAAFHVAAVDHATPRTRFAPARFGELLEAPQVALDAARHDAEHVPPRQRRRLSSSCLTSVTPPMTFGNSSTCVRWSQTTLDPAAQGEHSLRRSRGGEANEPEARAFGPVRGFPLGSRRTPTAPRVP